MKVTRAVLATTAIFPSISWALQGAFLWPVPQFIDSGATDVVLNVNTSTSSTSLAWMTHIFFVDYFFHIQCT